MTSKAAESMNKMAKTTGNYKITCQTIIGIPRDRFFDTLDEAKRFKTGLEERNLGFCGKIEKVKK